jgi:hypothetical protein
MVKVLYNSQALLPDTLRSEPVQKRRFSLIESNNNFCFVKFSVYFFSYGSTALYGPEPPRFVEVSWSHTFGTHHSR